MVAALVVAVIGTGFAYGMVRLFAYVERRNREREIYYYG